MDEIKKIKEDLEAIENKIEKTKREISELEGEKKQLFLNLQELGFDSLFDANKKSEENEKLKISLAEIIKKEYSNLKSSHEW